MSQRKDFADMTSQVFEEDEQQAPAQKSGTDDDQQAEAPEASDQKTGRRKRRRTFIGGQLQQMEKDAQRRIAELERENQRLREAQLAASPQEQTSAGSMVYYLPSEQVVESPWRNRLNLSFEDTHFQALREEIAAAGGNTVPILVRPLRADQYPERNDLLYEIAYGHRRHYACLLEGLSVRAIIQEMDDQALVAAMFQENNLHEPPSAYEHAHNLKRLLDHGVYASRVELSRGLRISRSSITEYMLIPQLPQGLIELLADPREISVKGAKEIHTAFNQHDQQILDTAVQRLQEREEPGSFSRLGPLIRELVRERDRQLQTSQTSPSPVKERLYHAKLSRRQGVDVERKGNELTLKVRGVELNPDERQELMDLASRIVQNRQS